LPTGGHDGTDGVEGNWNENRGGVSRTERGKTSGSPVTSVREFLTGAGNWKTTRNGLGFNDSLAFVLICCFNVSIQESLINTFLCYNFYYSLFIICIIIVLV